MQNDYQQYNIEFKCKRDPETFGWSFERCAGYKCINCGKEVSPGVVKFFDYQIEKVLCYKCQSTLQILDK